MHITISLSYLLHYCRREFHKVVKTSMIRAISFSLFTIALVVIMLLVFSSYTATGGVLTPKKFFTVLSLTSTLRVTSIHFFALAILNLLDCRVAATRIQVGQETNALGKYISLSSFHFKPGIPLESKSSDAPSKVYGSWFCVPWGNEWCMQNCRYVHALLCRFTSGLFPITYHRNGHTHLLDNKQFVCIMDQ